MHSKCLRSTLDDCFFLQDSAATTTLEADSSTREPESVAINYKPSPLQVKIGEGSKQGPPVLFIIITRE